MGAAYFKNTIFFLLYTLQVRCLPIFFVKVEHFLCNARFHICYGCGEVSHVNLDGVRRCWEGNMEMGRWGDGEMGRWGDGEMRR